MEIVQNKKNDVIILSLKGRFSPAATGQVEEKVNEVINLGEKKLAIDFTELEYINSMGLRIILGATKKMRKLEGNIVLFALKDHIKEVFEMTGFSSIMTITSTEEEALSKF